MENERWCDGVNVGSWVDIDYHLSRPLYWFYPTPTVPTQVAILSQRSLIPVPSMGRGEIWQGDVLNVVFVRSSAS